MPASGKILLVVLFALVYARANVFAQEETPTPVPLAAIDPMLIERGLDSIRTANQLSRTETRLYVDTALPRIQEYCVTRSVINPKATIVIKQIRATQELACPQCEVIPNHQTRVDVYGSGVLNFDDTRKASQAFTFHSANVYRQPLEIFVPASIERPEPSFWDSTAQPIIVTVGAAVIVALFFLIRS